MRGKLSAISFQPEKNFRDEVGLFCQCEEFGTCPTNLLLMPLLPIMRGTRLIRM